MGYGDNSWWLWLDYINEKEYISKTDQDSSKSLYYKNIQGYNLYVYLPIYHGIIFNMEAR